MTTARPASHKPAHHKAADPAADDAFRLDEEPAAVVYGALVPVEPADPTPLTPQIRRLAEAGLIAQLIAHREGFEWTREKRRAAPDVATAAYRASSATPPVRSRVLTAA
ncbi:hypothetical protein [Blastochloris tepida]|jgi:hypothetical protein|uniref:Uncharacterized protein n=1 Tax=Blastochloris tepida TaxID=2233851 RepID=A0A348G5B4_9HYPH|nr:hypothetical protein [Blastochloris tepida]BBF94747.1 hypothetical protein BLTE_34320 [Blastochloris tepida]